ncbi:MAG: amino acid ABC transporter permease [Lachnospiraceae bacterium]|nr:amino acid ABC transporter permease [Lachnospiraceae bacterium]
MNNPYFSLEQFLKSFPILLAKLPYTLGIVAVILFFSVLFSLGIAFLRMRKNPVVRGITRVYISIMRGIPLMLLLFVAYYGVPLLLQLFGIDVSDVSPVVFAVIAFVLSTSAFCSEILRSSFEAVEKGQIEAAKAMSLPKAVYYRDIIIPQACILALPNLGSLVITAIKQSSILYTIGILDIYQRARMLSADHFGVWQLEIFLALLLIYWGLAVLIDFSFSALYKRMLKFIP